MEMFNLNFLLGKTIRSINSSFLIAEDNGTGFVEFRMDYHSYFVMDTVETWRFQKILINSNWHENNHGQDILGLSLSMGELFSVTEIERLKMPYPSAISIWNGFKIKQVDRYGYSIDYNLIEPTNHILLLTSFEDTRMLLMPESAALGLVVTLNDLIINAFFNESFNHQLITHIDTFKEMDLT
jgi:hypothetical protein